MSLRFSGTAGQGFVFPDAPAQNGATQHVLGGWFFHEGRAGGTSNHMFRRTNSSEFYRIAWNGTDYVGDLRVGGVQNPLTLPSVPAERTWHHIAFRYTGAEFSLWLNGRKEASMSLSGGENDQITAGFGTAPGLGGASSPWNGSLGWWGEWFGVPFTDEMMAALGAGVLSPYQVPGWEWIVRGVNTRPTMDDSLRTAVTTLGSVPLALWVEPLPARTASLPYELAFDPGWMTGGFGGPQTFPVTLSGSISPAGALVRQARKVFVGGFTPSGALTKRPSKVLAGGLTPSGALVAIKVSIKTLAGSLAPAGALIRRPAKVLAGSLSSNGAVVKLPTRRFTGAIVPSGALSKRATKLLSGGLTPAGAVVAIKVSIKALAGSLGASGALVRHTTKRLAAGVAPSGGLRKHATRRFAGTLAPIGVLVRTTTKRFVGAIAPAGAVVAQQVVLSAQYAYRIVRRGLAGIRIRRSE